MKTMNVFSSVVFVGVLFASVIGQKPNQKSRTPLIVLRNVEQESESPSVASTTTIYLESSHEHVAEDEQCNCTPFNLCKTYESTEDGGGLINIRSFGPCDSYLDVCCKDKPTTSAENHMSSGSGTDGSDSGDQTKYSNTDDSSTAESPSDTCSCEGVDVKETHAEHPAESPSESPAESPSESPAESPSESSSKSPSESEVPSENGGDIEQFTHGQTPDGGHNTHGEHHASQHKCGQWNKYGVGFRIFNDIDSESQFGEFPSMVAIFKVDESVKGENNLVYLCGGSLIKADVVLTAAHCVIKVDVASLVIRAGEWDIKTIKEIYAHQDQSAKEVVTHPDYKPTGLHNDVALIFTSKPFALEENVQTVCMPEEYESYAGQMLSCITTGWGKTVNYNNYTISKKTESGSIKEIGHYEVSILKKVELPIVPNDRCMEALKSTRLGPKFVLHDSFMCAGGEKGKDACKGDGGSPLMCPSKTNPDHLVQVGIVSWGINCGVENIPGVYVNVASFRNWIDHEITNRVPL